MLFIYKYRREMIVSHNKHMVDFSNILALKQELLIASLRAENEDEIDQLKLWVAQLVNGEVKMLELKTPKSSTIIDRSATKSCWVWWSNQKSEADGIVSSY